MKKFLTFVVVSFVSVALFCGCKEKKTTGSDFCNILWRKSIINPTRLLQMVLSWTVVNTNKVTAYLFFM